MEPLQLKVDHLDELDLMGLRKALKEAGLEPSEAMTVSKNSVERGGFGVPPEMTALIEIGKIAVPMLIGVIALWASKGRKAGSERKLSFSWTKDGLHFERVEIDSKASTDTSDQISAALSSGLTKVGASEASSKVKSKATKAPDGDLSK